MNILYCKDLWWPFGSHLMHTMHRKIYADMHDYQLLYTQNNHPAYSLYNGRISELFSSISDIENLDIIGFADKNYSEQTNHENHFLLKYNSENKFMQSIPVSYNDDINKTNWHEFKPSAYDNIEQYRSSVMKKLAEPSNNIKKYLQNLTFIQEVTKLNGNYIAVHIRWTDKVNGWCTETDFYDVDVYFKYALEIKEKYAINNIVLNCDNKDAVLKFLNYNNKENLEFNILYDREEVLPKNDWKECIFQKWVLKSNSIENTDYVKDLLNGFKIYKTIFESHSVICNYYSNMALAPCVARNCERDINISKKTPYAIFPSTHWPANMFSQDVIHNRRIGTKEYEKLKTQK